LEQLQNFKFKYSCQEFWRSGTEQNQQIKIVFDDVKTEFKVYKLQAVNYIEFYRLYSKPTIVHELSCWLLVTGLLLQVKSVLLQVTGRLLQVTDGLLQVTGGSLQVSSRLLQVIGRLLQFTGRLLQVTSY
jgi:hypothetical protein